MTRTELKWILKLAIRKMLEIERNANNGDENAYQDRMDVCRDSGLWPVELAQRATEMVMPLEQGATPGRLTQIVLMPDDFWCTRAAE